MKHPRPLTPRQQQVVDAIGRGLTFPQIEKELGISAGRARNVARDAAKKIPNPAGLPPKTLILLWRVWSDRRRAS